MTVSHLKNEIKRLIAEYQLEDQVIRVIVETEKKDDVSWIYDNRSNKSWFNVWLDDCDVVQMNEPWWYFCKVCKQRLSKTDAMTICDDCLVGLDDREIGRR